MNDLPALVWAANLADLELHTFLHKASAPAIDQPTALAFDLDPGPPADIMQMLCCKVGLWLKETFAKLKLECFPKTSGSKGLQVFVAAQYAGRLTIKPRRLRMPSPEKSGKEISQGRRFQNAEKSCAGQEKSWWIGARTIAIKRQSAFIRFRAKETAHGFNASDTGGSRRGVQKEKRKTIAL